MRSRPWVSLSRLTILKHTPLQQLQQSQQTTLPLQPQHPPQYVCDDIHSLWRSSQDASARLPLIETTLAAAIARSTHGKDLKQQARNIRTKTTTASAMATVTATTTTMFLQHGST